MSIDSRLAQLENHTGQVNNCKVCAPIDNGVRFTINLAAEDKGIKRPAVYPEESNYDDINSQCYSCGHPFVLKMVLTTKWGKL
jgi:hypothetical protein